MIHSFLVCDLYIYTYRIESTYLLHVCIWQLLPVSARMCVRSQLHALFANQQDFRALAEDYQHIRG